MNKIIYNDETGRLNLNGDDLHCGTSLMVWIAGEWRHSRLEMDADDNWYLVGYPDINLCGLDAREE